MFLIWDFHRLHSSFNTSSNEKYLRAIQWRISHILHLTIKGTVKRTEGEKNQSPKVIKMMWMLWLCMFYSLVCSGKSAGFFCLFIYLFIFYNFIASHASHTCLTCHGVSWKPLENFWKCPLHRGRPARFLCFSRSSFFLFSIPDMSSSFEEPSSGAPISASHLWRACEWASKELSPRVRPLMSCHLPI